MDMFRSLIEISCHREQRSQFDMDIEIRLVRPVISIPLSVNFTLQLCGRYSCFIPIPSTFHFVWSRKF